MTSVAARRLRVKALSEQGIPRKQLPHILGATIHQIHRDMKVLYAEGKISRRPKQPPRASRHDTLRRVLSSLSREQVWWLFDATPKGALVSDTIAGILRDAYFESQKEPTE